MDKKKLSSCYCKNIRRLSNNITKYYNEYLKDTGLTLNQYSIMSSIHKIEPATVTDIANEVGLERTTIVRDLKPLIKNGLVEDISEKGKRNKMIQLTNKGIEMHNNAEPYWNEAQEKIFNLLGPERLQDFVDILSILVDL